MILKATFADSSLTQVVLRMQQIILFNAWKWWVIKWELLKNLKSTRKADSLKSSFATLVTLWVMPTIWPLCFLSLEEQAVAGRMSHLLRNISQGTQQNKNIGCQITWTMQLLYSDLFKIAALCPSISFSIRIPVIINFWVLEMEHISIERYLYNFIDEHKHTGLRNILK